MSLARSDNLTLLLDRLGGSGGLGAEVAVRLDVIRATGLVPAFRRYRFEASLDRLDRGPATPYKRIWSDAARELGAEVTELADGILEIRSGDAWTRVQNNLVMLDDAVTLRFGLQKALVNRMLAEAGLPVPDGLEFDAGNLAPAVSFMAGTPPPWVVKPVGGSGGYGVTSGIRDGLDLRRARMRAARSDRRLLIERQIEGDFYRVLFLDGELLDIVRRRPPNVTGDGRSTIDELIAAENRRRISRRHEVQLWPLHIDLDCIFTLQASGLTPSSVPRLGEKIRLKTVVSQNGPDDNETVREPVADELIGQARRAAQLVGLRLAGVDVITTNLSRSLTDTGGAILEVNGPPGFNYHYDVADPANATRVAVPILRALLREAAVSTRAASEG